MNVPVLEVAHILLQLKRVSLSSWHSKTGNKINRMMIEREKQFWGFKQGIVQLKLWY